MRIRPLYMGMQDVNLADWTPGHELKRDPGTCKKRISVMNIQRLGQIVALAGIGLFGCSPAALLDSATPEGTYTLTQDIPYGPGPRRKLDLSRPPHADGTTVV